MLLFWACNTDKKSEKENIGSESAFVFSGNDLKILDSLQVDTTSKLAESKKYLYKLCV